MTNDSVTPALNMPWLPVGKVIRIANRGEFFVRHHQHDDPAAPTLLLLHGWTASGDLQFFSAYEALAEHYSFVAVDHRGHGRGLRTPEVFTLEDAADDAAAVVRHLGLDKVVLVGYSMGGPISMLVTKRHPELVAGVVVQATALEWSGNWRERLAWRWLPLMGAGLRSWVYPRMMKRVLEGMLNEHHKLAEYLPWLRGEMQRADADSILQAGRALSKYDARAWASQLGVPAASLVTTKDRLVKPRKQRALAAELNAPIREVAGDHICPWEQPDEFASATVALVELVVAAQRSVADDTSLEESVPPASVSTNPVSADGVRSEATSA